MKRNYRVVKKTDVSTEGDYFVGFGIHEVYYSDDDVPTSCTDETVEPWGAT